MAKSVFLFTLLSFLTLKAFSSDFYNLKDSSIKGEDFNFSQFKDKVVLVVNIASQCGFTSQLNQLESLYQKYKNKGFSILGVPTNDFGGQTPEDDKKMLEFCQRKYQVTFPLLTKKTIKGEKKRVLYKFLTEKSEEKFQGEVGWNFVKFLINKKGDVVGRFTSYVAPDSSEITSAIEAALK